MPLCVTDAPLDPIFSSFGPIFSPATYPAFTAV